MPTKEKLEALKKRKAQIEKQISEAETRLKAKERKEETRVKILIGAAMLADSIINSSTKTFIEDVLKRAITEKRNIEFLQEKGWMGN